MLWPSCWMGRAEPRHAHEWQRVIHCPSCGTERQAEEPIASASTSVARSPTWPPWTMPAVCTCRRPTRCRRLLERGAIDALIASGVPAHAVALVVHGTTIVINAVTERTGARTALLTTAGFRDVLEIGRANRPDLYNLAYRKPPPFVPRRLRFEVAERADHLGRELVPLDETALPAIAASVAGAESRPSRSASSTRGWIRRTSAVPPRCSVPCSPASRSCARAR